MKKHFSHKTLNLIILLSTFFLLLSVFISFTPYPNLDLQITKNLQSIKSPLFSQMMYFVSSIGFGPHISFIVISTFVLLLSLRLRLEAFLSLFLALGSATLGSLVKVIADRPRPDSTLVEVLTKLADKSFPSNHVLIYTSFFGFLLYLALFVIKNKKISYSLAILSTFLVLTIGPSRIYLGAHWASDVLGGYLLGVIFLASVLKLYRIIESHAKR